MAWLAPWLFGFVTVRLYRLRMGFSEHAGADVASRRRGLRRRMERAGKEEVEESMAAVTRVYSARRVEQTGLAKRSSHYWL